MIRNIYDVAIIGAGAVGTNLARNLSRYRLKILVLEAGDVAEGSTRANSGIVHGGYAAKNGTRKAEFCHAGNRQFTKLAKELDFPFRRIGSAVLAFNSEDMTTLEKLQENGLKNGVEKMEITGRDEVLRRIPRVNKAEVHGALFCPEAGIVSPYEFAIALAENALFNGVEFHLHSPVHAIEKAEDSLMLIAAGREYFSRFVVNAAGVGALEVAKMTGPVTFNREAHKGQYIVLQRGSGRGLNMVIFQPPTEKGKGILVTPTTWNNIMLGPDSQHIEDAWDLGTDPESLAGIFRSACRSVAGIALNSAIRVFSGVRPAVSQRDFIIEWSGNLDGFLNLAGIESPGLTASPALALEVLRMLQSAGLELKPKRNFNPYRKAVLHPRPLGSADEAAKAAELPEGHPNRILCRCEQILEREIRDTIRRGLPLRSLDAVKRRSRAGMGTCQGTFCGPRVRKLLAAETGQSPEDIAGPGRDRTEIKKNLDAMRRLLSESEKV